MTSCSRYLVRLLPLRRWPSRSFGPTWVCSSEPGSSLLEPAPESLFAQVLDNARRHLEEMERMSCAVLQAQPALCWEPAGRRELEESGPASAGDAKEEPGSRGQQEERFQLAVDVAGFSPEELRVRVAGRRLTVTGQCEKQRAWEEGGCSREYRELCAEALLPEDVDLQAVTCSLYQDGQLCIQALRRAQPTLQGRDIPISIQQGEDGGAGPEPPNSKEQGKPPAGESEGPRGS